MKKNKDKRWSKSISKDNWTQNINVESLDNGGYLVRINTYGENSKGEYKDITKKYYLENNPLEKMEDPLDQILDMLVSDKNK